MLSCMDTSASSMSESRAVSLVKDSAIENNYICNRISSNKNRFFEYKLKIIRSTPNNNNIFDAEVNVSLKYLSNFWRSLDLPLINCEIELDLSWTKELQYLKYLVIPRIP